MKCLACGSEAIVSGAILDNSSGGSIVFRLDDTPKWKSMLGAGTRPVRAYGCVHCQHVQLAVDFTDKDRDRYRQIEGAQPGVLERINSESDNGETDS